MMGFLTSLSLTLLLCQLSCVESCPDNEYKITLHVKVEFFEQSVASASSYTKTIKSSKSFKKKLEEMSTSASISGSYGAFSASASASYSSLTDSVTSSEKYSETIQSEKTEFNTKFLQIIREIVTTVNVDGRSASSSERKFVDSVPEGESLGQDKLRERSVKYMAFNFGKKAVRNTFTESVCRKRVSSSEILKKNEGSAYQIWNDKGTGAWRDFSCWNPVGLNMLASIPDNGYNGPAKSFTFSAATGVLDNPRDYRRTWKDSGSGSSRDVSFWQPVCNQGFVGLGDLCKIGHGKPSKVAMKCVRKDLTKPCGKTQVWTDKGSGAWGDAIVFKSYDQLVQGMITSRRQAFCIK